LDAAEHQLRSLTRRESKVRRFLANYIDVSDSVSLLELVRRFADSVRQAEPEPEVRQEVEIEPESEGRVGEIESLRAEVAEQQQLAVEAESKRRHLGEKIEDLRGRLREAAARAEAANQTVDQQAADLASRDRELADRAAEIEALNRQIEETQFAHESELRQVGERLEAATDDVARLTQQGREFEASVVYAKRQRAKLLRQIEGLRLTNSELEKALARETAKLTEAAQAAIEDKTTELEAALRERAGLQSQLEIAAAKMQQLRSEIATLTVSKKSTELKLRAIEGRHEIIKKTAGSQAAAKFASQQIDRANEIAALKAAAAEAIESVQALLPGREMLPDLKAAVSVLVREFRSASSFRAEFSRDLRELCALLEVESSAEVLGKVRALAEERNAADRKIADLTDSVRQLGDEIDSVRRTGKQGEAHLRSLKLWESWGQRLHRLVRESDPVDVKGRNLRLALEEALLASVSSRSICQKTEILRAEKLALTVFDRRLLFTKQTIRKSCRPLIIVAAFARRIQRVAGHLPLGVGLSAVSTMGLSRRSPAKPLIPVSE
jgi:chromosome segregation ATPase